MKVYITKYALTEGIMEVEAEFSESTPTMVSYRLKDCMTQYVHGEGRDWHLTWTSALKRAEEMRKRKIVSLKKSIQKVEAIVFKPVLMESES